MERTDVARSFPHAGTPDRAFTHHEHQECLVGLDRLHDAARVVGTGRAADLSLLLGEIIGWVDRVVVPHTVWEEGWVYDEIDRRAGTPWATRVMRAEHEQVRAFGRKLKALRESMAERPRERDLDELRCTFLGLEASLRNHIEIEERLLMPLLDEDVQTQSELQAAPSTP
jgi:hemerythrin-like domain-containing protein